MRELGPGTFALAPMSPFLRWLTVALFGVPAAFLGLALLGSERVLLLPGVLVALLYLGVWLYSRPSRFVVTPQALEIVWPVRARAIPRADVAAAREISGVDFRRSFGLAMRIGVGGLWGGFGWLWTRRRGLVDFYISRTDGLVLIERRSGRPLLITPERPREFVCALGA